ncbi:MAG: exopolysaccharide biosynthesis polyprenyl glycosylphosphotransferase [Brachymonas sp.]|nr:exopolysaccharide biosynthesis polyprenyl glycosylphosphotransferase [Brachymonas sp.]
MFKLLRSNRFRLAIGLVLVCVLPAIVLPHWPWLPSAYQKHHWVSVAVVVASFVGTVFSLRSLNLFPGRRSAVAGVPLLVVWYAGFALMLLLWRLPYSLQYIFGGFALSAIWLLSYSIVLWRARQCNLAFVPLGRALHLDSLPGANWIRLDEPKLPDRTYIHAIVADLHAPALSYAWQKFLATSTLRNIPVYNIRQVEEALTGRVRIHHMYENTEGSLLPNPVYVGIKYLLDVALIVVTAPIVLPLMLGIAVAIRWESQGPAIFKQQRVGLHGKEFTIYKFRSMRLDAEKDGASFAEADDDRVTRVGRYLRKTRLDELPQLFNVIKGDMSLIGPRPEQKEFVEQFEQEIPFYQYRHVLRPGISGWAQVMHGYAAGVDETHTKIEHDFYYIKHFSVWLDFLIFLLTLKTMITGFGSR